MSERRDLIVWTPTAPIRFHVEVGITVQEAYDELPDELKVLPLTAISRGTPIPLDLWKHIRLHEGDHITFAQLPEGGGKNKGIIGTIVGVVAIVAGTITGQPWAVQLGAGLVLSGIGQMLIKPPNLNSNMADTKQDSSYYGVTGQSNEAKPYSVVPKLYGAHKIFPLIAAQPIIRNSGEVSRIATLYDFGVGMYHLGNFRIGDTPADVFSPAYAFHWNELNPSMQYVTNKVSAQQLSFVLQQNQPLALQSDDNAAYMEVDLAFARGFTYYNDSGNATNTSVNFRCYYRDVTGGGPWIGVGPDKVSGISASFLNGESNTSGPVDFVDPQGYVTIQGKTGDEIYHWRGTYTSRDATPPDGTNGYRDIHLSKASNSYNSSLGGYPLRVKAIQINSGVTGFKLTAASMKPVVAAIMIGPLQPSVYEIQITRLDPISNSTRRVDEATITQYKTFLHGTVVNLKTPHTMIEMSIVGSEKLSGVVQNFSADAVSVLPWYDVWGNQINFEGTRNPAWICLDILMGPCNPRPIPAAQIDFPAWVALAAYCDQSRTWQLPNGQTITAPRFMCDIVVDYQTTIQEMIDSVLSGCHATRKVDWLGRWSVIVDEKDAFTPRQLLTPANSWNFSARRTYPEDVHAFRVSFIDSSNEFQKQEIIVYRDGYSAANATKFESLGTFGITDWYHAWAYGRYMFAQAIARQEIFSVTMDVENLAVTRGDGLMLQHDVPIIGGYPCRVIAGGQNPIPAPKGYSNPAPGQTAQGYPVMVSAEFSTMPGAYTIRRRTGVINTGQVLGMIDSNILILDNSVGIYPDDLIVFGQADQVTEQYIVLGIQPGPDMTATLTLVLYNDQMYDSDIGPLPAWDPTWGTDVTNSTTLAVDSTNVQSSLAYEGRKPIQTWLVTFTVNQPQIFGWAEAWLVLPGYADLYLGRINGYSLQYSASVLDSIIGAQGKGTIRLEPFTAGGLRGKEGYATLTITRDITKPGTVKNFAVNVQAETINMFWELQTDPDTWQHEIRYHPDPVNGTWELGQRIGVYDWWVTTAACGARTGKYMIRTIDSSGNWSDIVWQRTAIEVLPDIDLVEDILEIGFPGTMSNMHLNGDGKPQLDGDFGAVVPEGFYFYAQTLDLGSIYEVRITSKILGHAISSYDFMASWVPIANQKPLASGYAGWWSLNLEVRGSNTPTVMADWVPLASVDPIGGSREDAWTPWRGIRVGDITARFIQFRIRGTSEDENITAIIDDAHVVVDVKERRWFLDDQPVAVAGSHFFYDPPYMEVPTIAITFNGGTATRYEITNKNRYGFDIKLFNGTTAVAGNIDIAAIGWGKEKTLVI